ncbi:hypothetical protein LMTR3_15045 [Bradyrhizobium sp. LMTR 3]|nr:hypothetical protein LMTR3_15045 [Bradyrhizobium sp. LMTR 3]
MSQIAVAGATDRLNEPAGAIARACSGSVQRSKNAHTHGNFTGEALQPWVRFLRLWDDIRR